MRYQPRSGVTNAKIELAHRMIMSREQGDGLINKMINLSSDNFWERHLRKTHPTQYERNDQLFENKLVCLDELQEAKTQWAALKDRRQIKPLSEKLESLANQLGLSVEDMLKDEPLDPELYKAQLEKIGYQRDELSRQLTREAMRIADL